jgi:PadR family transcriptional regulator, regulatory protein PadR
MSETGDALGGGRTPANLELLLLAVLAREALHGYAIIASLRQLSGGLFDLNEGSAYPALHRLERTGMVESAWSEVQGRRRRVYRLTRKGRRALADGTSLWERTADAVRAVLAPLPGRTRRRRT